MDTTPYTPADAEHSKLPRLKKLVPAMDRGRAILEDPLHHHGEPSAAGWGPPPFESTAAEIAGHLADLVVQIRRIADALDPPPPDLVESGYVAGKLGCTTTWVADMARNGEIPRSCIVPGTGNGKPWKFRRSRIDEWIARR